MYQDDRRLLKKLLILVLVKILVVFLLWWFFIADHRIKVDSDQQLHQHLFAPAISRSLQNQGNANPQPSPSNISSALQTQGGQP